jgi:MFS superfamily sulfate permease-like transporter
VVFRWEAPLFFANAGLFRQHLRALVRDQQPRWIVLQCEAVTDVDVTAAERLEKLDVQLNVQGVHLAFVELRDRLAELLLRYGLYETLDRDHFYGSVEEALAAIAAEEATLESGEVTSEEAGHDDQR